MREDARSFRRLTCLEVASWPFSKSVRQWKKRSGFSRLWSSVAATVLPGRSLKSKKEGSMMP